MADRRSLSRPDAATARHATEVAGVAAASVASRTGTAVTRLGRAWRVLPGERRLAAVLCLGLFVSLFLPWYRVSLYQTRVGPDDRYQLPSIQHFTGWDAFSFVEAAVLLVAVSVLVLLFLRAEGRAFHLPGGDGPIITLAGAWACFLVIWRMFDKQGVSQRGEVALSSGIEWGIFVALLIAGALAYAGTRIRAARVPEPPLPTEDFAVFDGRWRTAAEAAAEPETAITLNRPLARSRPQRRRRRSASGWPAAGIFERPPGWLSGPPDHEGAASRSRSDADPAEPSPADLRSGRLEPADPSTAKLNPADSDR